MRRQPLRRSRLWTVTCAMVCAGRCCLLPVIAAAAAAVVVVFVVVVVVVWFVSVLVFMIVITVVAIVVCGGPVRPFPAPRNPMMPLCLRGVCRQKVVEEAVPAALAPWTSTSTSGHSRSPTCPRTRSGRTCTTSSTASDPSVRRNGCHLPLF